MATAVTPLTPIPTPISAYNMVEIGALGADYIDDTGDYTGDWGIISIQSNATFTKLVNSTIFINGATSIATLAKSFLGGVTIYGRFSEIQLASGAVLAYRAKA